MIGFNPYTLNTHQLQQSLAFQHIQAGNAHFQQAGALLNSFQPQLPCQPFMPGQPPPHLGCMPPPQSQFSNAPAGKGLTKNKDGSITTAGGYTSRLRNTMRRAHIPPKPIASARTATWLVSPF